jgi:hypothetical protein
LIAPAPTSPPWSAPAVRSADELTGIPAFDGEVEQQAGDHEPERREPPVHEGEPEEKHVGPDDGGRSEATREREGLQQHADQRCAPPVDPHVFERSKAAARDEPDQDSQRDQDQHEHRNGPRLEVSPRVMRRRVALSLARTSG